VVIDSETPQSDGLDDEIDHHPTLIPQGSRSPLPRHSVRVSTAATGWIAVFDEAHSPARQEGIRSAEDGGITETLGYAMGTEWLDAVGAVMVVNDRAYGDGDIHGDVRLAA
jgi:hypothetical protein